MSPVIVANHLTLFYYVISHCGLSFNLIFQVEYHELETFNGDSSSLSVEVRKEHTMYTMYTMAPNVISLPPPGFCTRSRYSCFSHTHSHARLATHKYCTYSMCSMAEEEFLFKFSPRLACVLFCRIFYSRN